MSGAALSGRQRALLACGVVGPLLFIVVFLIEGATRADYDPWQHFVSSLSHGARGWIQITSFVLCGGLVLCFAVGLRRELRSGRGSRWITASVGIFGISLVAAGLLVTDPLLGYPPGAPSTPTLEGALHMLFSLFAFAALASACLGMARRFARDRARRGWSLYSAVTGVAVVLLFVTTSAVAALDPEGPAGLIQRITIVTGWGWVALLAVRLLRRPPVLRP